MKHWKLIIIGMTMLAVSLHAQNAGNHNPEFRVPDTFMSGEPYIFIGEDDTEVFDPRTPITLQLRNPPEVGEPYNGSTTLQWSNSPSNVLAFDESNAMTGFKDEDQQGEGETSGSWSWSNDNQSNFDGDIIFFQGSASAQSGSTVTLESYHSDDVNDKFTKDFTLLKVDVESIDFVGSGNQMLVKSGEDSWENDSFTAIASDAIDYPEWSVVGDNEPDHEPICYKKGSSIELNVKILMSSPNITYNLVGVSSSGGDYLNFREDNITSDGSVQTVNIVATDSLPDDVQIIDEQISWSIEIGDISFPLKDTGNHKIYVTWDDVAMVGRDGGPNTPPEHNSVVRLDWSVRAALAGQSSVSTVDDIIVNTSSTIESELDFNVGLYHSYWWLHLENGSQGDCISSTRLAAAALNMVGINVLTHRAWPTADASGFPTFPAAVSNNTARLPTIYQFSKSNGQTYPGALIVQGNRFEAFLTYGSEANQNIKAYTVFPVSTTPYTNQTYYYLEILHLLVSAVSGDQFWVDHGALLNGLTIKLVDPATLQLYPEIPPPSIPATP